MSLDVLLIGSGGREHALAWSISQSEQLGELYAVPGNAGIADVCQCVDLDTSDFGAIISFVQKNEIDLVVIGPEQPLVDGLGDYLEARDVAVFGPSKAAARLEGSKAFAKKFMNQHDIPTASHRTFQQDEFDEVAEYVKRENRYPVVLKASGLAGGKGVFICKDQSEVEQRLSVLKNKFKDASQTLVVEEFMEGEEASVFVISDGRTAKILGTAQDHKRIGDGDTGLNTGGMGAYAPSPLLDEKLIDQIDRNIIMPTISGMLVDDKPYKGILYLGLMVTEGQARVVEYNCRFGDPECQVILPLLKNDLLDLMWAAANENLHEKEIVTGNDYCCCVVMASDGYPVKYEKGFPISGFDELDNSTVVFQSGTAKKNGQTITDGGRVLGVVQKDSELKKAIDKTYREVEKISFKNVYYRSDIGQKGLKHVNSQ